MRGMLFAMIGICCLAMCGCEQASVAKEATRLQSDVAVPFIFTISGAQASTGFSVWDLKDEVAKTDINDQVTNYGQSTVESAVQDHAVDSAYAKPAVNDTAKTSPLDSDYPGRLPPSPLPTDELALGDCANGVCSLPSAGPLVVSRQVIANAISRPGPIRRLWQNRPRLCFRCR